MPSFNEDAVFLLAVAVVSVLFLDTDARAFAEQVRLHSSKITLMVILGIGFSFYTAIFTSFKNEIQKFYMFWFVAIVNFLSALAVITILNGSGNLIFYFVIPAINIGIFILLVVFWYADILDISSLSNKSPNYSSMLYGTFIVLGLTLLSKYVLEIPWPTLLAVSVGYATLFNRSITSHLPQIFIQRDRDFIEINSIIDRGINHALHNLFEEKIQYDITIVTDNYIKDLDIPDEYRDNIDTFLRDEIYKIDPTNSTIAIISFGEYTYKRFWFSRERQEMAVIIDVYLNGRPRAYQFCQMIVCDSSDKCERYKGLIYLNKITNIFI